ncbi:hypothetical protein ACFL3D_05260 [Candidatus Omnitrophota bacterium]
MMVTQKDKFIEHLLMCLRDELITQLPNSTSPAELLKEAQWNINNYIEHLLASLEFEPRKTG